MSGRTAVIAGGGPVGAVAAILLAAQSWKVQVFEAASVPDLRPSQEDNRAYRLNLSSRGLDVLKLAKVNMKSIIANQGRLLEAAIYKADGSTLRSFSMPVTENPQCVRVFRDEIALCIIKAAQRLYPEAIHFHFNTPIEKVDLDKQAVYVFTAGSTTEVQYDLLVGADGAGSVVRSALEQIMPPGYIRRYRHKQVYTMATATPSCPAEIPQHSVLQMHNVKGGVVFWDGQGAEDCRVGLTIPQEQANAIRQGNTEEAVMALTQGGPSMPDYARKAAIDLVHAKPQFYPIPSWTHLSQLYGPKAVLLGDAAHTMSPVWGQGLNSGLEDVAVFAQCLEQQHGDVDAALTAYNKTRLPDVQAIMTINEVAASNDVGLASQDQDTLYKLWLLFHKALLVIHVVSRTVLHKVVPKVVAGPCLIAMAMGTLPYRLVLSAMYKDGILFAGLLMSIATLAVRMFSTSDRCACKVVFGPEFS